MVQSDALPKKILIVEDEAITAMHEKSILQQAGYEVMCAESGEVAIDFINSGEKFDLILMDIDLGTGMDGTKAAQTILDKQDIPILFLSSHTEPEIVERTEKISSYGYVVKNSGETVLLASIKMAFRLYDAKKELLVSQQELRESEQKFKSIIESTPRGIHMYELMADGRLVFTGANPSADNILGVDHTIFIGKTIEEAFPPLADTEVPDAYKKVAREGEIWHTEQVNYEDEKIIGAFEVTAFKISEGKMVAAFTEITERKKAEEALKLKETQFRGLVETSPIAMLVVSNDVSMKIEIMNSQFLSLFGYGLDEVSDMDSWWLKAYPDYDYRKEVKKAWKAYVDEIRSTGDAGTGPIEARVSCKDRSYRYVEIYISFYVDRALIVFNDMTEKRQFESVLYEKEELYRSLFSNIKISIGVYEAIGEGKDFIIKDYNPSAEELIGITTENAKGKKVTDLFTGIDKEGPFIAMRQVYQSGKPERLSSWKFSRDGHNFWGMVDVFKLPTGEIVSIFNDITESIILERELQNRQELIERIMDTAPEGIVVLDKKGQITFGNTLAEEILGLSKDEITSRTYNAPQWNVSDFEGNPVPDNQLPFALVKKTGGTVFDIRHAIESPENKRVYLSINAAPLLNEKGGFDGIVAVLKDVTASENQQRQLKQTLEEKDALFKELQHRIKNSLTIITGMVSLELDIADDSKTHHSLENIRDRVGSLAQLYEMMWQAQEIKSIRLDLYIMNLIESLKQAYVIDNKNIIFKVLMEEIVFDVKRTVSVGIIVNELITNSLKYAFPDGMKGTVTVEMKKDKDNLLLGIADDGIGLPVKFDIKKAGSMGLKLVDMLSGQLRGRLKIKRMNPTSFSISVPFKMD